MISATSTPRMVTLWEAPRPILLPKNLVPKRPAMADPASGARGTARRSCGLSCPAMMNLIVYLLLALECVQIFDVDGVEIAEQHNKDRQADCGFRGGHSEDEENEDLSGGIAEIMRERDEIHVHRKQHQFNRHQQNDDVLAVEENTDDGDRKQDRAEDQVMSKSQSHNAALIVFAGRTRKR